eukprot:TRINITY_DN12526_c0_g1_i3.p2 TRINITY_DN12526_c0_g1~~TRINITY_DN12526_c0_g1_i3.p2  ORF type:complete len:150 (+),score=10.19 TRINITY_DN12526_c0_g1_i3:323-772(+)
MLLDLLEAKNDLERDLPKSHQQWFKKLKELTKALFTEQSQQNETLRGQKDALNDEIKLLNDQIKSLDDQIKTALAEKEELLMGNTKLELQASQLREQIGGPTLMLNSDRPVALHRTYLTQRLGGSCGSSRGETTLLNATRTRSSRHRMG